MKSIIIFSDGTGQRGGLMFDERRSNIYKLFRATRCGPDSSVDPAEQLTFYDPGLGTLPPGHDLGVLGAGSRWFYNLVSQATGLGITRNIIDCYAAIIRLWRPGDRIFLFGFSRGAYTVRCLGAVLSMCGVPTKDKHDQPLRRESKTTRRIAAEAVKKVYQHTESRKQDRATERQKELLRQRTELARHYREAYASADLADASRSNAYPYFIGVFDTVASLANPAAVAGVCLIAIAALAIPSGILAYFSFGFWTWFVGLASIAALVALAVHTSQRIRFEFGLERNRNWRPFHLTASRMKFYDTTLNPNVRYARHALAIDEFRPSFQRVPWEASELNKNAASDWFEQLWFAGDHSDIGGSYLENESRLSDISLKWMAEFAVSVGMKCDSSVLKAYPDPNGPQHDETRSSIFQYFGKCLRSVDHDAPLHPSVLDRFRSATVLDYDVERPYRPESLRNHDLLRRYYPGRENPGSR